MDQCLGAVGESVEVPSVSDGNIWKNGEHVEIYMEYMEYMEIGKHQTWALNSI
jgi:hypothetical protein